jgi:hypothetical protein
MLAEGPLRLPFTSELLSNIAIQLAQGDGSFHPPLCLFRLQFFAIHEAILSIVRVKVLWGAGLTDGLPVPVTLKVQHQGVVPVLSDLRLRPPQAARLPNAAISLRRQRSGTQ